MSNPLEERRLARRRQILEAACRCFARRGFRETAMLDICREANLSIGTIYRYFPDKEALILSVADLVCRRDLLALKEVASDLDGARDVHERAKKLENDLQKLEPRWLSRLRIDLWTESLHNPAVRDLVVRCMERTLEQIRTKAPDTSSPEDPRFVLALLQGLALQREILQRSQNAPADDEGALL
jgi:AcrR family transcriptional regulator